MLEVRQLCAGYGHTEVLRGVDMTINTGEIVALLGSNGVGKTTFNAALSGLIKPWSGSIAFNGVKLPGGNSQAAIGAGLVQVPEGRHIFPNLTV
ncbi:MAG: ATP-binding cassette domain-containing protein, partial [Halocynthiibacter sp.]